MTRGPAWRAALRLAGRDLRRSRGRSSLVALMVGSPVLLLTVLSTLNATNAVSVQESLPYRLGRAQAELTVLGADPLYQDPEGVVLSTYPGGGGRPWDAARLQQATGGRVVDVPEGSLPVRMPTGSVAGTGNTWIQSTSCRAGCIGPLETSMSS